MEINRSADGIGIGGTLLYAGDPLEGVRVTSLKLIGQKAVDAEYRRPEEGDPTAGQVVEGREGRSYISSYESVAE
jgi:hypothetical protein